ncbi:adenylyl-sulfate kinase [SAR86 cluster bacterium]|nr:adenylyl-sulfate kinase [SAR86 cluster bacterium]
MTAKHEIKEFIEKQNKLRTLRFITCGSVDDGKSTLLGRLLYEAQLIFDDQIDNLLKDSKKLGTQGGEIDFALLVDGLAAEREQGITIDVAYRFFTTEKRKFIVADSPGHEQYTRNMVTAASGADLAIILIDARKGVLEQTKRHSFIANLVGIRNIIVAVNKMDLVSHSKDVFTSIISTYKKEVAESLSFDKINFVPVSALLGENITKKSKKLSWANSKPIMELLEDAEVEKEESTTFNLPVQYVSRPNLDFRGFCGSVASGKACIGDQLIVASSNQNATINDIYIGDKKVESCGPNDSITITLDREIDISRGDILSDATSELENSNLFNANIIWFDSSKSLKDRNYLFKIGTKTINGKVIKYKNKIDINSYMKVNSDGLSMNEIGECEVLLDESICFMSYKKVRSLGSFIIIDRNTNLTIGAGVINHPLRRSENIVWEKTDIDLNSRVRLIGRRPKVLWFTGLSGSGKSTISNLVERKLFEDGVLTYILDGDNLRHGLNRDLGFKEGDRIENLRRAGEVAKILHDAGVFVLASFISPFLSDRKIVRSLFHEDDFVEIYIKCDLETLMSRDPKKLYKKALEGDIPNFTGISSPYEEPKNPEILIDTSGIEPNEAVNQILSYLEKK